MTPKLVEGNEYVCELCGVKFIALCGQVEAIAEAEMVFGHEIDTEDSSIVCRPCFDKFKAFYLENGDG